MKHPRTWIQSDRQRRTLCQLGFLSFVIVPTLIVVGFVFLPNRKSAWSATLESKLGLPVQVDQVRPLSPQRTQLSGIDVLTGSLGVTAQLESLTVTERAERTVLECEGGKVRLDLLRRSINQILDQWLHREDCLSQDVDVVLHQVTLVQDGKSPGNAYSMDRIRIAIHPTPEAIEFSWWLFPAGTLEDKPIEWKMRRELETKSARLNQDGFARWSGQLSTHEHYLPLWLVESWIPSLRTLGGECEFQGIVNYGWRDGKLSASLAGQLSPVDLHKLVTANFPRVLSGQARIQLQEAEIIDGTISALAGAIHSSDGQIGGHFLSALESELSLLSAAGSATGPVPFSQVALRFNIQKDQLKVAATNNDGVLIFDVLGQPLLAEGSRQAVRPHDLVRALVSEREVQVPLTRETSEILRWLPLPASNAVVSEPQAAPRAILRMDDP